MMGNPLRFLRAALLDEIRCCQLEDETFVLRAYTDGDDERSIDWHALARTGELYARVPVRTTSLTLATLIDTSASMRIGKRRTLCGVAEEVRRLWCAIAGAGDRYYNLPYSNLRSGLECGCEQLTKGMALLLISDCHDNACTGNTVFRLEKLLRIVRQRCSCTLLLARDPWYEAFPLQGYHVIRDSETGAKRQLYIGARERASYRQAAEQREKQVIETFTAAGWRTGILTEEGAASGALLEAFGASPRPRHDSAMQYSHRDDPTMQYSHRHDFTMRSSQSMRSLRQSMWHLRQTV